MYIDIQLCCSIGARSIFLEKKLKVSKKCFKKVSDRVLQFAEVFAQGRSKKENMCNPILPKNKVFKRGRRKSKKVCEQVFAKIEVFARTLLVRARTLPFTLVHFLSARVHLLWRAYTF